jgi:hypothetical protein
MYLQDRGAMFCRKCLQLACIEDRRRNDGRIVERIVEKMVERIVEGYVEDRHKNVGFLEMFVSRGEIAEFVFGVVR